MLKTNLECKPRFPFFYKEDDGASLFENKTSLAHYLYTENILRVRTQAW